MKYCENCRLEFEDNVSFCFRCGSLLKEKEDTIVTDDCSSRTSVKYCEKCGRQFDEDKSFCYCCGSPLVKTDPTPKVVVDDNKGSKVPFILLVAVTIILTVFTLVIFLPRNVDIDLDDIHSSDFITTLIRYGYPSRINANEGVMEYRYKIKFDGKTCDEFLVYWKNDEIVIRNYCTTPYGSGSISVGRYNNQCLKTYFLRTTEHTKNQNGKFAEFECRYKRLRIVFNEYNNEAGNISGGFHIYTK